MIEIDELFMENKRCTECNTRAIVSLNVSSVQIPLCKECIKILDLELNNFNKTTFCYQCKHFVMSESGFEYGGSCGLKAFVEGHLNKIEPKDAGYIYSVDNMHTCNLAERREVE